MAEVGYCQAGRGLGGATVSILQHSCQAESHCQTWVRNEDPHDQALNEAREVHRRALEAAHLLEQNIEMVSQAVSRVKSAKCWHLYSHSCAKGRPQGRHAQCNFSRPRGGDVLQGRSLERTLGAGDGRRRGEGEQPGPSTHPRARTGVLPGHTNNHVGCQG